MRSLLRDVRFAFRSFRSGRSAPLEMPAKGSTSGATMSNRSLELALAPGGAFSDVA